MFSHQGFAEVVIVKNDYWNGWLGFYPSNSTWVTADEDSGVPVQLTVERRNASFQYIQVLYWIQYTGSSYNPHYDMHCEVSGTF